MISCMRDKISYTSNLDMKGVKLTLSEYNVLTQILSLFFFFLHAQTDSNDEKQDPKNEKLKVHMLYMLMYNI